MTLESMFSLRGRTALVAGASRGIGLAIARALAAAGARTLLAARSLELLERHAAELRAEGLQAQAVRLDVTDPASVEAVASGPDEVDILVNVAGTNIRKSFLDYTPEEYDFLLRTNLHGLVELTRRVGGRMIARARGGKVINIGSLMSLRGLPYLSVYAITKSGLAGLTRVLAAEWARYDIQVNCIAPGMILTDLNREVWQRPGMREWLQGAQANPRLGTPEDVAAVAVFLASPASDYITGQVIAVDGGYTTTAVWPYHP
ncbi:MAG: SDR family oxidoreductase [Bryobacterales bacterium]|nr:SDR family oxidoreductase [Bryobacterales bacterium]